MKQNYEIILSWVLDKCASGKWHGNYGVPVPETGRTSSSELIKNRAELNESDIRVNKRNKRWAGQILLEKTVADEVRSLMKELPCKLQYDWSRPINAESGRGKQIGSIRK
ncbi:hypothetical protein TNCV_4344711 [Trichonephila clavipes]|nr:hypothetical protein TNCV_4344711 [Trichonephila clavipes]